MAVLETTGNAYQVLLVGKINCHYEKIELEKSKYTTGKDYHITSTGYINLCYTSKTIHTFITWEGKKGYY